MSSTELNDLGVRMADIFANEARDPAWAPEAEQMVREQFDEFLRVFLPDAQEFQVECRETMCTLSFVVAADREELAFGLQQMMPLGEVLQPWDERLDDGRFRVGLRLLDGEDWRPLPQLRTQVRDRMAARFPNGLADARRWLEEHGGLEAAVGIEVSD